MILTALAEVSVGGERKIVEGPLFVDPRWTVQACVIPPDEAAAVQGAWKTGLTAVETFSPTAKVKHAYTVKETPQEIEQLLKQEQPIIFAEAQSLLTFALAALDAVGRKAREEDNR